MNHAAILSASEIANLAHDDAQAHIDAGTSTDDVAKLAPIGAMSLELTGASAQLYIERFVGHCVNVACGTAGR